MNNRSLTTIANQQVDVETIVEQSAPAHAERPPHPLMWLHSLLRGRYILAISLLVIGILVGGWQGYRMQQPQYLSTGMLRVKPILPRILYQNEQNGVMPMFESFIGSQVALLTSQRVVDMAMQDREWKALGRGLEPHAISAFRSALEVSSWRGSEMIIVSFSDADPNAAMIAVRSVIDAYQKLYGENESDGSVQRMEVLDARRTALTNEQKGLKDRILALANEYGSTSLDSEYEFRMQELNKTESRLKELQLAIAEAQGVGVPTTRPVKLTPDMVAAIDPLMRAYLSRRQESTMRLMDFEARLGENHTLVADERDVINRLDIQIDAQMKMHRKEDVLAMLASGTPDAAGNLDRLKNNEARIRALYEQEKTKAMEVGRKSLQLNNLKAEAEGVKAKLDETKNRIEQLNVEGSITGRISVVSAGEKPLGPDKDKRVAFAAAGAATCGGLGLGIIVLIALLDSRIRHIADTRSSTQGVSRLLGVLPNLKPDFSDPEQVMLAAQSVHQIRNLLEREWIPDGCRCIAITSSSPGAGKTSLTSALGMSFSASGSKTLLIDCDMIGGGLTGAMNKLARDLNEKNGNHVSPAQIQMRIGLREALSGKPLKECVVHTNLKDLYLLPLGTSGHAQVGQLSAIALRRVINEARQWFDFILVDTGPILGSLEARVVATVADDNILVVPRGEQRNLIHRATEHLRDAGANVTGIVFNRAREADIVSSGFSSSASRQDGERRLPLTISEDRRSRLGPIATAVAAVTESAA